jgi:hypothetical protein
MLILFGVQIVNDACDCADYELKFHSSISLLEEA